MPDDATGSCGAGPLSGESTLGNDLQAGSLTRSPRPGSGGPEAAAPETAAARGEDPGAGQRRGVSWKGAPPDGGGAALVAQRAAVAPGVDRLASEIISIVAMRVVNGRSGPDPRTDCIDMLSAAAGSGDSATRLDYLRRMQACGATPEDIVDLYIPQVARRFGEDWANDVLSFAEVTIGSARLQAMVRELDRSWQSEQAANSRAPSILMVVQEHDYHTLGTMVAACKFRRLGVSVHMMLGQPDREVLAMLNAAHFDMVAVSLSTSERAGCVRKLVKLLKSSAGPVPPIVVGGPASLTAAEIRSFTGVDHVTSDCAEALHLCGLSIPKPGALQQKGQG